MTKAEIQSLINSNLASASIITATKHREVENALLNYMDNIVNAIPLAKGNYVIGNAPPITSSYPVTFAVPLSTSNYIISSTLISLGDGQADNEIQYAIGNKTASGFTIYVRETANVTQNISLDYVIFSV